MMKIKWLQRKCDKDAEHRGTHSETIKLRKTVYLAHFVKQAVLIQ